MDVSGAGKNIDDASDIQILETPPPCSKVNLTGDNATAPDDTVTSLPKGKRPKTLTSDCWNYFEKIGIGVDGKEKCRCKGCGSELGCTPRNGTSHLSRHQNNIGISELDAYLSEPRFPPCDGFNILAYWKERSRRCPDLAKMAFDILSIPITTVASESAFSIGSRVFNKYRSSLKDDTVQVLLCTRSWLHGFEAYDNEEEDDDEINTPEDVQFSQVASNSHEP